MTGEEVIRYEIISEEEFKDAMKKVQVAVKQKDICSLAMLFYIKGDCLAEFHDEKKIYEAGDAIRSLNQITIFVIDGKISFNFLDCLISADFCIAGKNGKFNLQSKYDSSGLFTREQIAFLLGKKKSGDNWWRDLCIEEEDGKLAKSGLLNVYIENVDEQELDKKILHPLLFEKSIAQIQSIKRYFNRYKMEDWNCMDTLKQEESKSFCVLSDLNSKKETAGHI